MHKMDVERAARLLRRAQRRYEAAIHQTDSDKDVIMGELPTPPIKTEPMDAEDTEVIIPTFKTMVISVLIGGFYVPITLQHA
jgi:hypothetical protein